MIFSVVITMTIIRIYIVIMTAAMISKYGFTNVMNLNFDAKRLYGHGFGVILENLCVPTLSILCLIHLSIYSYGTHTCSLKVHPDPPPNNPINR